MTLRRKDDEEFVEVGWGRATKAYRWVLLGAVLAATPIGQNVLNSVGIKTPVAAELTQLSTELASVKGDLLHLKEDVTSVKTKTDTMETKFAGFQIDFDKYRKEPK